MAGSIKLTQKMLNTWLEAAWRDGFTKGVDGEDSIPDFSTLDPRGPDDGKKLSPSEAQVSEYNPCKCGARMFREGFGVQCSRKPFEEGLLCKTHQKVIDNQPSEYDLPFGWFNKERPTHHLDQKQHNKPIAWSDMKKASKSPSKKRTNAKEMREQLTEMGISIDGLKGKALTLRYNEVIDSQSDSETSPQETPSIPQQTHTLHEQEELSLKPIESESDSESEDPAAGTGLVNEYTKPESPKHESPKPESPKHESPKPGSPKESPKIESPKESPKVESPKKDSAPSTTSEFKKLFQEIGISTDGLRGKKAFKDKYEEYIADKNGEETQGEETQGEETEDMSDDELGLDTSNFVEVDFEGVEYLEDEETSNIYNVSHQLIGKWNEDGDDIIWEKDTFKVAHDTMKD